MENEKINSEKLGEILDKIFLLNHSIVTQMINSYKNPETRHYTGLNEEIENIRFEKLAEYFQELRYIIREEFEMFAEMTRAGVASSYDNESIINEVVMQSKIEAKEKIVSTIISKIESYFIAMNFCTITITSNGKKRVVNSIYDGEPEESIREQEYISLKNSIEKQIGIIFFEDYFSEHKSDKRFVVYPSMSSCLIDNLADRTKYLLSEINYDKLANRYRQQEEVFDEFPELRDLLEKVEYLKMEERYKRKFDQATSYLNDKTNYTAFFAGKYASGNLPRYVRFTQDEIDIRISEKIGEYLEGKKRSLKNTFQNIKKKYKPIIMRRNMRDLSDSVRLKLLLASQTAQSYIRKVKGEKKIKESQRDKTTKKQNPNNKKVLNSQHVINEHNDEDGR